MKKAQITIFIILGILALIGFSLVLYLTGYTGKVFAGDQASEIKNFVQDCAAQTFEDGLIILGQQGGRITLQDPIQQEFQTSILLDTEAHLPTIINMEKELNRYMIEHLKDCLDFSVIKGKTLIKEGAIQPKTTIGKRDVTLTLDYPLTFQAGDKIEKVNDYFVQKPAGLLKIMQIITTVTDFQLANNYLIPDNPLQEAEDFQFRITSYDHDLFISIKDTTYLINNKPYEFVFAERFT